MLNKWAFLVRLSQMLFFLSVFFFYLKFFAFEIEINKEMFQKKNP